MNGNGKDLDPEALITPRELAGALGVTVWVALPFVPDWRWLLHREDSPWYPSMRLFRQKELGNWTELFARLANDVQQVRLKDDLIPG